MPDTALQADQSNQEVMTVAPDGTVVAKIVTTGALVDGLREIESGIAPGDKIVINGLMRAWPGTQGHARTGQHHRFGRHRLRQFHETFAFLH